MPDSDRTQPPHASVARSLAALLACPGVLAVAVPLILVRATVPDRVFARAGLLEVALGTIAVLWCALAFHRAGGALAPWWPPAVLVDGGLYRWSRNPASVGIVLIVVGWALGFDAPAVWLYAGVLLVALHLRIVFGEEPQLARRHGDDWLTYRKRVPRWVL